MRSRGPLLAVTGAVVVTLGAVYAFVMAARVTPPSLGPQVVVTATPSPAVSDTDEPDVADPVTPAPPRDADDHSDDTSDDGWDDSNHGDDSGQDDDDDD
ncbi:hypothetical protein [Actinocorallia sp. A-T 12471]|uniref:hypothetical protein n=1 Tax=Actinocorallia sp. A-T 12471 TaxID=3089813 RepID=UPI0029D3C25C|nr:hypothetical protein [Actinocorallia sp. A-T 12471]MDX6739697.1 hypothetical protein [Actinocorallia sp. A-T 12471]